MTSEDTKLKRLFYSKDVKEKIKYIYKHPSVSICTITIEKLSTGSSFKIMIKRSRCNSTWIKYGNDLHDLLNTLIKELN